MLRATIGVYACARANESLAFHFFPYFLPHATRDHMPNPLFSTHFLCSSPLCCHFCCSSPLLLTSSADPPFLHTATIELSAFPIEMSPLVSVLVQAVVMFVGSFAAGFLPLMCTLSPKRVRLLTTVGALPSR